MPTRKKFNRYLAACAILPGALGLLGAGCGDDDGQATCGNGKLGLAEQCDCGQDASDLPVGCVAPNGAPGSTCTADCRLVPPEDCDNGLDDDFDGLADCDDPDCESYPACQPEICNNRVDDNGDGLADCDDPQCVGAPECDEEICGNGLDDNLDGHIDCQDLQCYDDPACVGVEICWNDLDDDGNGFVDCDDPQCQGSDECLSQEVCDNDEDDDRDGRVDCADRSCIEAAPCTGTACQGEIDLSVSLDANTPSQAVAHVSIDVPSAGNDLGGGCDIQNGKEYLVAITALTAGRLRVVYTQHGQGKHNIGLYLKGGDGTGCTAALNQCAHLGAGESGVIDYGVVPSSKYFLVVSEGVIGGGGQVDLAISLAQAINPPELCNNLFDDDGNGETDCGDVACYEEPGICEHDTAVCGASFTPAGLADETLGDLAASQGAEPWNIVLLEGIDTRGEDSSFSASCMEFGGGDRRIHFRLTEPSYVQVGWRQNMNANGDHVITLGFPGGVDTASQTCQVVDHRCVDTVGDPEGLADFPGDPALGGAYPPGDYYLGVKAYSVAREGRVDLQLILRAADVEVCSDWNLDNDGNGNANCADPACATHHVCIAEDCNNGIDDDGDGLMDCADTDEDDPCQCSYACRGRVNSCDPNRPSEGYDDGDPEIVYLGTIPKGQQRLFDIDTSSALADYGPFTSCTNPPESAGNLYPDVVLLFDVLETVDIQVNWTFDGPEHVGRLYKVDRCHSCAHPDQNNFLFCYAVPGPAGQWYAVNLVAGTYAFIVKPYASATGGRVYGNVFVEP